MDISELYKICSKQEEDSKYIYEVSLNPEHEVFKGHFPGMPVMPGVCMLQLVKDCLADAVNKTYRFDYMKSCKFLSVVDPREHLTLWVSFTLKVTDLQAVVSIGESMALKLRTTVTE